MGIGVTNVGPLTEAMEQMLTVEIDDGWRTGNFRGKDLWLIQNESRGLHPDVPGVLLAPQTRRERERLPLSFLFAGSVLPAGEPATMVEAHSIDA